MNLENKSQKIDYSTKVLEVKNLKQHFRAGVGKNRILVRAVDGVSFDIHKKEVFGLVGESGCGKTTTGRTIMRLYKPTSGTVTLNGNIIVSGNAHFHNELKTLKQNYEHELLKLNKHAFAVHELEEKYHHLNDVLVHQMEKNDFAKKQEIKEKEDILLNYEAKVFNEKEEYHVLEERLLFAFRIEKEKILNQTKNMAELEYKALLRGLKLAQGQKIEGIHESAALSKEAKERHLKEISEDYEKKLEEVKNEFLPKIESANAHIMSKQTYKKQASVLKEQLKKDKAELKEKHEASVNLLKGQAPDKEKVKTAVADIKERYSLEKAKIEAKIKENNTLLKEEIAKVTLSKEVDQAEKERLTSLYKKQRQEIINKIKASNAIQRSRESEKRAKAMQMIFQDPISSLNPRMTVHDIVAEGLVINGEKDKEFIKQEVIKNLELVGLAPEYIPRYPHEFSGGQRQRIGIARALIMNPSIIIADEPISALDVSIKAQVINLLSELREKLDLSILFIAHDLSVVKFFCDRIAVMYFGKIVEMASSEELFKNPLHGYTKSLLSAIPHPDPESEKTRERINYSPMMHNYRNDPPKFVEIKEGHFVLANKEELEKMRKELGEHDE